MTSLPLGIDWRDGRRVVTNKVTSLPSGIDSTDGAESLYLPIASDSFHQKIKERWIVLEDKCIFTKQYGHVKINYSQSREGEKMAASTDPSV